MHVNRIMCTYASTVHRQIVVVYHVTPDDDFSSPRENIQYLLCLLRARETHRVTVDVEYHGDMHKGRLAAAVQVKGS